MYIESDTCLTQSTYPVSELMRVSCSVDFTELENDNGIMVDSVSVTCDRCGHSASAFGTSEASIRWCCVSLREDCPGEDNFYVTDEE